MDGVIKVGGRMNKEEYADKMVKILRESDMEGKTKEPEPPMAFDEMGRIVEVGNGTYYFENRFDVQMTNIFGKQGVGKSLWGK